MVVAVIALQHKKRRDRMGQASNLSSLLDNDNEAVHIVLLIEWIGQTVDHAPKANLAFGSLKLMWNRPQSRLHFDLEAALRDFLS